MKRAILIVVGSLLLVVVASLLMAFPLMWLWNWALVPAISVLNPITSVWQAWCIMIICNLLFNPTVSTNK